MRDMILKCTLGLGLMVLAADRVVAQSSNCAPRATVIERLTEKYGETRRSIGLGSNNVVVEVYASDASGSWTIIATLHNGMSCLVAAGQSFEAMVDVLPEAGNDA